MLAPDGHWPNHREFDHIDGSKLTSQQIRMLGESESEFVWIDDPSEEIIRALMLSKRLKSLVCSSDEMTDGMLERIAKNNKITHFHCYGILNFNNIRSIATSKTIRKLSITLDSEMSQEDRKESLRLISKMPTLEYFQLEQYYLNDMVSDNDITELAGSVSLRALVLYDTHATGTFLRTWPATSKLEFISVDRLEFDCSTLRELHRLASLKSLSLKCLRLHRDDFVALGGIPNLKHLSMQSCDSLGKLDRDAVSWLGKKNMRSVVIPGANVDKEIIDFLCMSPDLEFVMLSSTNVGDDAFRLVASCPKLRFLDVSGRWSWRIKNGVVQLQNNPDLITDEGVVSIAEDSKIEELHLESTDVTDRGVKHIAKLKCLIELSLRHTPITDKSVDDLMKLRTLRKLNVRETLITKTGIARLKDVFGSRLVADE